MTVKKLNKHHKKKIDSRKGVLLASYSRKKTRKRKKGKECENNGAKQQQQVTIQNNATTLNLVAIVFSNYLPKNASRSITPSPRESVVQRPQALAVQRTRALGSHAVPTASQSAPNPNELHPMGVNYRGQLMPSSRQASSNASEGGGNRESSLDDSGVVDDHEDQDISASTLATATATATINPGEVQVVKCNGNIVKVRTDNMCTYQPEYLSQIVILGKQLMAKCTKLPLESSVFDFDLPMFADDVPDRNCTKCVQCCIDYEGWLQFQNCLYKVCV